MAAGFPGVPTPLTTTRYGLLSSNHADEVKVSVLVAPLNDNEAGTADRCDQPAAAPSRRTTTPDPSTPNTAWARCSTPTRTPGPAATPIAQTPATWPAGRRWTGGVPGEPPRPDGQRRLTRRCRRSRRRRCRPARCSAASSALRSNRARADWERVCRRPVGADADRSLTGVGHDDIRATVAIHVGGLDSLGEVVSAVGDLGG